MKYYNIKTSQGVETVDHIERKNFATYKEYITELKRLKNEYFICGMNVYISQRSTKDY